MRLSDQLHAIEAQILAACKKSQRDRSEVRLLLATKTILPERLREVAGLGYTLFGENKAQELNDKVGVLKDLPLTWHFIGHLQTNKVKDVIDHCELIHSVDRLSLATEISKRALAKNKSMKILVEVNTSGEDSKSGVSPDMAPELCHQISDLKGVQVMGLMTLAENTDDEVRVRRCFEKLRKLKEQIQGAHIKNITMQELSMGMSQDFALAIEEGATLIRLGSAIFGTRNSH